MKRKCLSLLAILLMIASLIFVSSPLVSANESATPTVSIDKFNLVFDDNVYLKYAVKFEGVDDSKINASSIGMLYFTAPQSDYTKGGEAHSSSVVGYTTINDQKYYTFEYRHISAKQMTDYIYSVAYLDLDGERYYSAPVKYSVLEYAYIKLGKTGTASTNGNFKNMLSSMLTYGASAQKYFNYNTERLADASYYQVNIIDAMLPDGTASGLYLAGEKIVVTATETNAAGESFLYWKNSAGAQVSTDLSYTIDVTAKNETYTAVYGKAELPVVDFLIFTEQSDGTYSVKANFDAELPLAIAIPTTHDGKAVTAIEENAFLDCTELTSISLPNGIKVVGDKAFSGCIGLTELILPETVTTIGTRAFYGCKGLTEITIPQSVSSIGTQIFYKASNLHTVYYNATYASQDNLFLNLSHITKIVFGGSYVPSYILYNNTFVKEIEVLNSVTSINNHAFDGCSNLTSITIPDSVTSIGDYVFYNCSSLTSIVISNNVTSIGSSAFSGCSSLTSIVISNNVTSIGSSAFSGCSSLTSIVIPNNVMSIGRIAFSGCSSLTSIVIPDSVTSIGDKAFDGCSSLTSVYIFDIELWCKIKFSYNVSNPLYYGANLYLNNVLVTNLTIPDSVTSIGYYAFSGCSSLTSIVIPDSVTSIGSGAFSGCSSLTSIVIPDSVTSIGSSAFSGCSSLTSIVIPDSVTSIGASAFRNCSSLTSITIPDSVTVIENDAFRGCSSLESITIPDSVTSIGSFAFDGCSSLTSVTIPDSVTSISAYAFRNCSSLTSITIPDSVTSIDVYAFRNCSSLTSITIPDSVTSIGESAFSGCSSLTNITIPNSVTSIDAYAFYSCSSLKNVYYSGTADDWAKISIGGWNFDLAGTHYYYSQTEPTNSTYKYWHYVDGVPTKW